MLYMCIAIKKALFSTSLMNDASDQFPLRYTCTLHNLYISHLSAEEWNSLQGLCKNIPPVLNERCQICMSLQACKSIRPE